MIEPIYILIALLPLVAYLFVLGVIRASGRVLITTGGRDIGALGFAVCGWIAIGPMELFFPKPAAAAFGGWVWLALATFYGLIVSLLALTSRPRLVVYGRTPEQMIEPLYQSALKIDPDASCQREVAEVYLPNHRVRLRVAGHGAMDSASIESFEPLAVPAFWDRLLGHMRDQARETSAPTPRRGGIMVAVALILFACAVWQSADREKVVEGFRDWLFR